MKPAYTQLSTYINYDIDHNDKDPKFKVFGHLRTPKYKIQRAISRIALRNSL